MRSLEDIEAEVDRLHKKAQELNKQGWTAESTAVYKQMSALDDQALALALDAAVQPSEEARQGHAASHPDYCRLLRPSPWGNAEGTEGGGEISMRDRALGAVLGAVVADAAAQGVHWVYDVQQLASWEAELVAAGEAEGLEFMEPPRNPFYSYPTGRASSYGEQTLALLACLAAEGGLDCCRYAQALWAAFGPGFEGYRDVSTKAFLRRFAAGKLPPATGAPSDRQANAFTRLPPLVALFAGEPQLGVAVEAMVRTTQDDDGAVAYGLAAADILQQLILGEPSITAAVRSTVQRLRERAAQVPWQEAPEAHDGSSRDGTVTVQNEQGPESSGSKGSAGAGEEMTPAKRSAGAHWVVARGIGEVGELVHPGGSSNSGRGWASQIGPKLAGAVADALQRSVELAPSPPPAAHAVLGRNCHLPTSLQTALQILMHFEGLLAPGLGQAELEMGGGSEAAAAQLFPQHDNGDASSFCLPCSLGGMGGTACAWRPPNEQPDVPGVVAGAADAVGSGEPSAGAPGAAAEACSEARLLPSAETYVEALRAALREGGCCASRASLIGACLGALGGDGVVPAGWVKKVTGIKVVKQQLAQLSSLRD